MRAMLVAAGLGTRLAPLTDLLPKPAVPLANRPAAAYMMEHLVGAGICDMVANSFHLADSLQVELEGHVPQGAQLAFVREQELLGTGGGVKNAIHPQPGEDVVIANAKLLFAPNLAAAISMHQQSGALATMVLRSVPPGSPYGAVDVDSEGRVHRILDRSPTAAAGLTRCMFTGVHLLSAEAHHRLPERGCTIRDGYVRWLEQGAFITSVLDDGLFVDVGQSLAVYHSANMDLCAGVFPWSSVQSDSSGSVVHASAEVGPGARIEASAVGAGVRIAAGVRVQRAVVWPGSHVTRDICDCIITPKHILSRQAIYG